MPKVLITGSCGSVGRVLVREFADRGFQCSGADISASVEFRPDGRFVHRRVDFTDFGETVQALEGYDCVIHAANAAYPDFQPDSKILHQNVLMNYNVFAAASMHSVRRVVWLSSASVAALDSKGHPAPECFPIDEDQPPRSESVYALSKSLGEHMAAYFGLRGPTSYVGIRSALVVRKEDYGKLAGDADEPEKRRWHYWSYIDVRDLARLIYLAAEAECAGASVVNACAADTALNRASADICAEYFPQSPCRIEAGSVESLYCRQRARDMLGFEPEYSWRQYTASAPATG